MVEFGLDQSIARFFEQTIFFRLPSSRMAKKPPKSPDADILNFENNELLNQEGSHVVLNENQITELQEMIDKGEITLFTLADNTRGYKYFDENGQEQIVLDKVLTVDPSKELDESLEATAATEKQDLTQSDKDEIEASIQAEQDDHEKDPDWQPESPTERAEIAAEQNPAAQRVKKKLFKQVDQSELDKIAGNTVCENTKDQTKWAVRKFKGIYRV